MKSMLWSSQLPSLGSKTVEESIATNSAIREGRRSALTLFLKAGMAEKKRCFRTEPLRR